MTQNPLFAKLRLKSHQRDILLHVCCKRFVFLFWVFLFVCFCLLFTFFTALFCLSEMSALLDNLRRSGWMDSFVEPRMRRKGRRRRVRMRVWLLGIETDSHGTGEVNQSLIASMDATASCLLLNFEHVVSDPLVKEHFDSLLFHPGGSSFSREAQRYRSQATSSSSSDWIQGCSQASWET